MTRDHYIVGRHTKCGSIVRFRAATGVHMCEQAYLSCNLCSDNISEDDVLPSDHFEQCRFCNNMKLKTRFRCPYCEDDQYIADILRKLWTEKDTQRHANALRKIIMVNYK
jgi:hypothetical protein